MEDKNIKDNGDIVLGEIIFEKDNGLVSVTLPILEKITPTDNFLADMQEAINLIQKAYVELLIEVDDDLKKEVVRVQKELAEEVNVDDTKEKVDD